MKKILQNAVLFCGALLFAFAIAELASRLFLPPPQKISSEVVSQTYEGPSDAPAKNLNLNAHPDEGGLYKGSKTGRRLKPNRKVTIANHRLSQQPVLIETNSLGYRNPEIGEKQGTRILFLGDSITFADYLNEEQTFVRLVEQMAQQDNKDWQTINAGVGAISLKNELAILLETGLSLDPDVVVVNFYLNDFQPSKGIHVIQLPPLLEKSRFIYYLNQTFQFWQASRESFAEIDLNSWKQNFETHNTMGEGFFNHSPEAFNAMLRDTFSDTGAAWSIEAWQYMTPIFEEFARLAKEHNFKLFFVTHPTYQQVYTPFDTNFPQQQLNAIGNRLKVPVLDLLPALQQQAKQIGGKDIYQQQRLVADLFYDQCHHTPTGSEVVATEMYQFLSSELNN